LALSSAALCQACGSDAYKPAPIPPATRTVAVYRDLPETLTARCRRPQWDDAEIQTDVDLLGLANRINAALQDCAEQIDGIRQAYGLPVPPNPQPNP
jgi:hypothetical protein